MQIGLIALVGVAIGVKLGGDQASFGGLLGTMLALVTALQLGYLLGIAIVMH